MRRKVFVFIGFFLLTGISAAQSWEDSLRTGIDLYKKGAFSEAFSPFLQAQKLAPEGIDLSQDIGNVAYRNKDFEMAEKAYRIAVDKKEKAGDKAAQWHNVGNSQMALENYKSAIESYKNALRLAPENDETRYNLAEAIRRLKIQEEQQQQQNQQNQQNQEKNDNEQSSDKKEQQNNSSDSQENAENQENENNSPENSAGKKDQKNSENEGKLSDGKMENILDDILKQEINTRKKTQGIDSKNENDQIKSGKKW